MAMAPPPTSTAPLPGVAAALPQAAKPEDANTSRWRQILTSLQNDPRAALFLIATGSALLNPRRGQSTVAQLLGAPVQGLAALGTLAEVQTARRERERKAAQEAQELALKTRETAARERQVSVDEAALQQRGAQFRQQLEFDRQKAANELEIERQKLAREGRRDEIILIDSVFDAVSAEANNLLYTSEEGLPPGWFEQRFNQMAAGVGLGARIGGAAPSSAPTVEWIYNEKGELVRK